MTTAGTPDAGMTSQSAEPYKLRRARKGRMIAGVAAGLATASGLDVTVVRICIGASMLTGLGIIGYLLLWIVIPEEQPSRGRYVEPAPEPTARVIRVLLLGGALVVLLQRLGVFWPFEHRYGHNGFGFDGVLALVLISLGVGVLVSRYRSTGWPTPQAANTTTATTEAGSTDAFVPWTAPGVTPIGVVDDDADGDEAAPRPVPPRYVGEAAPVDTTRKLGGAALGWARVVGWLVLLWWVAAVLVLVGLWRFDAVDVTAPVVFFGVCWVVFTIVVNALLRVRKPSVVLATLVTLLIPVVFTQGLVVADGPIGTRTLRPLTAAPRLEYRQAVGQLELDFSATRFATSRATDISARIGTGALQVTIPDNASVTVVTSIKAGGYDILGKRTTGGVGQRETLRFDGCGEAPPHLRLHLTGGAGWLHLQRVSGADQATCPAPA